jgi:DNA mismatch repair protein MutS2
VAGASSGLEIARRFGIPSELIDVALESVKDSSRQASEYLRRIKRESEEAEALRKALEEERAAVAEKFASLDKKAEQLERQREALFQKSLDTIIHDFERRSRELVATIQDRSERLKVERESQRRVAELKREAQRAAQDSRGGNSASSRATRSQEGSLPPLSRGIRVLRDGMPVSKHAAVDHVDEVYKTTTRREIAVGDKVKLKSFGSIGIVDQIKDDEAEVRVKSLRLREKLDNLELVELAAPAKSKTEKFAGLHESRGTEVHLKSAENGRSELNVIGQTTDEAVDAVDKFLDEASLASLAQVRIVHGHGTGALRRAIADMLKDHPHVARFKAAPQDQGGAGATLVELKQ